MYLTTIKYLSNCEELLQSIQSLNKKCILATTKLKNSCDSTSRKITLCIMRCRLSYILYVIIPNNTITPLRQQWSVYRVAKYGIIMLSYKMYAYYKTHFLHTR